MVSKCEQEELEQTQREYEQTTKLEEAPKKKQWRPWKWSWQTLLLWTFIVVLVKIIMAFVSGG